MYIYNLTFIRQYKMITGLTLITVICTICCAENISFVKYFLWPDFTLPRGLAESTSVSERRGRVFEAHSKHRE